MRALGFFKTISASGLGLAKYSLSQYLEPSDQPKGFMQSSSRYLGLKGMAISIFAEPYLHCTGT